MLKGHEPYPALAIDRHWTLVAANGAVAPLLAGIDAALLKPPVNVLRRRLHPGRTGAAHRQSMSNGGPTLLARLRRQIDITADPALTSLLDELRAYPAPAGAAGRDRRESADAIVVPFRLATDRERSASSARRRSSARLSTSRSRNWRSRPFSPPTMRRGRPPINAREASPLRRAEVPAGMPRTSPARAGGPCRSSRP